MTDEARTLPMTEQVPLPVAWRVTGPNYHGLWREEPDVTSPFIAEPLYLAADLASLKARIQVLEGALEVAQKEICSKPLAKGDGHEHDLWLRNKMRAALNPEQANDR
jgi:hypothetical protein